MVAPSAVINGRQAAIMFATEPGSKLEIQGFLSRSDAGRRRQGTD